MPSRVSDSEIANLETVAQGTTDAEGDRQAPFSKGDKIGGFVVIDRLGEGGMGVVLLAYDPNLDRKVAIKLLHSKGNNDAQRQQRHLLREAQAMAKLAHPNVVAVYETGIADGRVFIVMEYVRGQSVAQWLKAKKRESREIVRVFQAAGAGLAAAHKAGLVHRDFKPDNVLIGNDGRVRVTDFGLASTAGMQRQESSEFPAGLGKSDLLSETITRDGMIVGTPRYMSPEHFKALTTDGRTDQFSFCLALYESLFSRYAFKGETFSELAKNTLRGRLVPPPKGICSVRVRKAILQGLSSSPEDRHDSMDALIAELSDSALRRYRWPIAGALLLATLAFAAASLMRASESKSIPCQRKDAVLNLFWDADNKQALRTAFANTGSVRAGDMTDRVTSRLDDYAESWVTMRLEACQATHVQGIQSEAMLDLRISCLERRQREASELIFQLTDKATSELVDSSVGAVQRLSPLDYCANQTALSAAVPPPHDPKTAVAVEELKIRIDRLQGENTAGNYKSILAQVTAAAEDAATLGYAPLMAEAYQLLGQIQDLSGESDAAEKSQYEAVWAAQAGHHDYVAAEAWIELLWIVGDVQGRFEEAQTISGHVRASLARVGTPPRLQAKFLNYKGNVFYRAKKYDEAVEAYNGSLEIRQQENPKNELSEAVVLNNLSVVRRSMGEFEAAIVLSTRSLEIRQRELGEHHPRVAVAMTNLGIALSEVGQLKLGIDYFRQALEIKRTNNGVNSRSYGIGATNLGDSLTEIGRFEEALPHYLDAKRAFEESLGPDNTILAYPLAGEGDCLVTLARYAEAIEPLQRSLQLQSNDLNSMDAAATRFNLAKASWGSGDEAGAREAIRLVESVYANAGDKADKELAEVQAWVDSH